MNGRRSKRIAEFKRGHSPNKIEQLILFPTDMGFVRLAPDHPEMVTRIYGHDRWKEIYERRSANKITAEQARSEYVRLYASGFTSLGYGTVLDRQITKANGTPMYFLIFATDNDAGEKIMDWVFDRVRIRVNEELGQTTLFNMESGPRERRLGDGRSGDGRRATGQWSVSARPGSSARLRRPSAPLFEEECDALGLAAVAQLADPLRVAAAVPRPDSPPAISQSMPSRSSPSRGPSSGSAEMKRTAAGTSRR